MANEKIQTINDVSQAPERMTGAMYKHFVTKENVSIIDERHACVRNGVPCIYAPHLSKRPEEVGEESCAFKDQIDKFLLGSLKSGLVLTVDISHCDHYKPENDLETLAHQMEIV